MRITYTFPKPSRFDLADIRARVDAADLGTPYRLFEDEAGLEVETDDTLTQEALERLKDAFAGYVYAPKAFTFPAPARYDLGALGDAFRAAGVAGFSGMSTGDPGQLRAEFPERGEPFTADELAALEAVAAGYVYVMTLDECRRLRAEAYPAIGDQLDALWKGGAAADAMKQQIAAVKAAYPKPTT